MRQQTIGGLNEFLHPIEVIHVLIVEQLMFMKRLEAWGSQDGSARIVESRLISMKLQMLKENVGKFVTEEHPAHIVRLSISTTKAICVRMEQWSVRIVGGLSYCRLMIGLDIPMSGIKKMIMRFNKINVSGAFATAPDNVRNYYTESIFDMSIYIRSVTILFAHFCAAIADL